MDVVQTDADAQPLFRLELLPEAARDLVLYLSTSRRSGARVLRVRCLAARLLFDGDCASVG